MLSERSIQTLRNIAKCILRQSCLPPKYWSEAFRDAVLYSNISRGSSTLSSTELFGFKTTNNLKRYMPLGCKIYFYSPEHKKNSQGRATEESLLSKPTDSTDEEYTTLISSMK
jgi:hypothetical protein